MIQAQTKNRLEDFVRIAQKVRDSKFIRENQGASFSLSVGVGEPLKQTVSGFNEDDLRSMLMDLRKFTLEKDGVRFTDICSLLLSETTDPIIRKNVDACRERYEKLMTHSAIKLIIDEKIDDNMKIIKTWFYGHYFHEDAKHKENLSKLGIGEPLHKFNFMQLVEGLSVLACVLANNAKLVLDETQN
jgi:hypothetical protein